MSKYTDAIVQDGVALGSYSSVAREAGTQGYVPEGVTLSGEEKNSATLKAIRNEKAKVRSLFSKLFCCRKDLF